MTDREAYVAFNLAESIGSVGVAELAERAGGVAAAWERFPQRNARLGGEVDVAAEFEKAKRYGVEIVTLADATYPARLRAVRGCPLVLYVKGDVAALSKPMVALVGTRRATAYGTDLAGELANGLVAAGWGILSGLALGIDAASHRAALDAGGTTVGVIGSGLDEFYPTENRLLARDMVAKGGAVVSEFPFGRKPDQQTFPQRNHVVAALAAGVVAVEAPTKSGTLITVSIAADLGRPVMAVPGRVDSRSSAGCLRLIRDGAVLVRNADDVIEELSSLVPRSSLKSDKGAKNATTRASSPHQNAKQDADATTRASSPRVQSEPPPYTVEEALLVRHLDAEGVSMDRLVDLTGLPPAKVASLAMTLRLKGRVRFLPGNRVALPFQSAH